MTRFSSLIKNTCAVAVGISMFAACAKNDAPETTPAKPATPAIDLSNVDNAVKPGDDFFKYANGTWMKNNPIPDDKSRFGAFEVLNEENLKKLRDLFETAAKATDAKKGSVLQQISDFYASGMDEKKINEEGIKPLQKEFESIDKITDIQGVNRTIALLQTKGVYPLFYYYAAQDQKNSAMMISATHQGGLGLPDRDYYFGEDDRSKNLREEYLKHLEKMFGLFGSDAAASKEAAAKIMNIETLIAGLSKTRVELRDPIANYNKMTLAELDNIMPHFDWNEYLANIEVKDIKNVVVGQPDFMKGIDELLGKVSVTDWKIYLRWNLMNSMASYLNKEIDDQNFAFYGTVMSGQKVQRDRWKRVMGVTSGMLGEAVGQLYVEKYFPPRAKEKMVKYIANLKAALGQHISKLDWMSEDTKTEALAKLSTMGAKVGYPDKWIDYSSLEIDRDSYVRNIMRGNAFDFRRTMDKIGKPVDRAEWHMTPQTINAYYSPTMNEVVFPAAILQPPFFFLDADDAVNYGAICAVIGHEMTHGFDDQGRMYDKEGNIRDWWTKQDAENFKEKTSPLVEQFNGYQAIGEHYVNGELTLGENIADLGGVTVSYTAMLNSQNGQEPEKIDGLTATQRFFMSYAQVWRQNIRDKELMKRVKEDVHSPGSFRVNGVVANMTPFYEAFDIKPENALYRPDEERTKIW